MKLLITGANGQLGRCLQDRLADTKNIEPLALSSSELDIRSSTAVRESISNFEPDIVINAAAYTAVDKAEDDADQAFAVNHLGVKNLAHVCAEKTIPLIHVSTDYVFDGEATAPYLPESETNPIGVYGMSKLQGELAAAEMHEKLVTIRTAWVYSEYGNNFVKTMLRLAESRDEVSVVDDQVGCPTYAGNIASAILKVCQTISEGSSTWGTYHYVDSPQMSWFDFAEQVFSSAKEAGLLDKFMKVSPISSEEYPTKTKRPAFSVLDTSSFSLNYQFESQSVSESLTKVLVRMNSN